MPALPRPYPPAQEKARFGAIFSSAQSKVLSLLDKEPFRETCSAVGVQPDRERGSYRYWQTVARFAGGLVMRAEAAGLESAETDTFGLLATAPMYLYAAMTFAADRVTRRDSLAVASYQQQLRRYAWRNPDVPQSVARVGLSAFIQRAPVQFKIKSAAWNTIPRTLRGARNQLAAEQQFQQLGWAYQEASPEDDLQGIDYLVWPETGRLERVDIKSSTTRIRYGGIYDRNYRRRPDGVVEVATGLTESDFEDRFFIPDQLVAEKSLELAAIFDAGPTIQHTA